VSAVLNGTGGVDKTTAGTVTLSGANTYTGVTVVGGGALDITGAGTLGVPSGSLSMTGGVLDLGGTTQFQNGGVTLTGGTIQNGTLQSNSGFLLQSATVSAVLAGGVPNVVGGTVTLSGANTYTFGTAVFAGSVLDITGAGMLGNAANGLFVGGVLDLGGTTQTQNGGVALTGGAIQNGTLSSSSPFLLQSGAVSADLVGTGAVSATGGTVTLSGTNTYTGGTTIPGGGTLQLGAGGTTGSIVGNVTDNGTLVFDRADNVTFSGAISGTGSVTQQGGGVLTLTGANTYAGGTTIAAGTVRADAVNALGSGGVNIAGAGALEANAPTVTTAVTINNGASATFGATAGNTLTPTGTFTVPVAGAATIQFGSAADTGTVALYAAPASSAPGRRRRVGRGDRSDRQSGSQRLFRQPASRADGRLHQRGRGDPRLRRGLQPGGLQPLRQRQRRHHGHRRPNHACDGQQPGELDLRRGHQGWSGRRQHG
jgi:fibronectin-binding autotransporter adhesin